MKKSFLFLVFASMAILGCKKDNLSTTDSTDTKSVEAKETPFKFQGEPVILGKELENPYTVEVMKKAYENVKKSQNGLVTGDSLDITTTHYYVRFLPANWAAYDALKRDRSLTLYDYPLHFELASNGSYYHDPNIPVGNPTWQYASVPVTKPLPTNIRYEILANLYIPDGDNTTGSGLIGNSSLVEALVDEAMRLTNNASDWNFSGSNGLIARYVPSGRITFFDSFIGDQIPLEGAIVRMRQWFTTYEERTDVNGGFSLGQSFRNPVNYSLSYENGNFDIRSGNWGGAWFNGPRMDAPWNLDMDESEKPQIYYAHAFKAAYHMYYRNWWQNINKPPVSMWHILKIGVHDDDLGIRAGDYAHWRTWFTWPDIRLYAKKSDGSYRFTEEFFGTTVHELAHAIHWNLSGSLSNTDHNVSESWGRVVEWVITNEIYQRMGKPLFNIFEGLQTINSESENMRKGYTPIFIDMIDDINQRSNRNGDIKFPPDNVSGFSLNDIQHCIDGSNTLTEVMDKAIALNRDSREDIEALFSFYINDVDYF